MVKTASSNPTVKEHLRAIYPDREMLTTSELAKAFSVRPETVHRSHSMQGGYLGLTPIKLANRRLLWPLA